MVKFNVKRLGLILTLLIASQSILSPLNAWIDHIFDFHFDRKDAGLQFDHEKYDGMSDIEIHAERMREGSDRSRDCDRGTNTNTPDRDK